MFLVGAYFVVVFVFFIFHKIQKVSSIKQASNQSINQSIKNYSWSAGEMERRRTLASSLLSVLQLHVAHADRTEFGKGVAGVFGGKKEIGEVK